MITIKSARRAAVPIVCIQTSDAAQTIDTIRKELNGKADEIPLMRWDIIRGLVGLNESGNEAVRQENVGGEAPLIATQNPIECLSKLENVPERSIVFFMNAHNFWANEAVRQGIWNLRDEFKTFNAMLVLLVSIGSTLPDDLKSDVVTLSDSLPDEAEILAIVDGLLKDVGEMKGATLKSENVKDKAKIVDTLSGLSAFSAEQALAMSVTKDEIDRKGLWERKRSMIEQTDGLSVWRGGETFEDIGGYDNVKSFMRRICKGNSAPRAIVFIDEIEKSMAGSQTDTSGVSQDQLRCLLTWMQDRKAAGSIFIGPPGTAKSVVAKATGNDANIPTIALDMGGMKGSLVGESERKLRTALAVVDAVSQGKALFIATCNSIGILPPELRRRFSLGTFFFPLPNADVRRRIWDIYIKRFKIADKGPNTFPNDDGWTGAEIENCVTIAWRLKCTLKDAASYVVPVSVSAKDQIDKLCREAHKRYINADKSGLYEFDSVGLKVQQEKQTRRAMGG